MTERRWALVPFENRVAVAVCGSARTYPELVEVVARAICAEESLEDFMWSSCVPAARAVLAALGVTDDA